MKSLALVVTLLCAGPAMAEGAAFYISKSGSDTTKVCRLPDNNPDKLCVDESKPGGMVENFCLADGVIWSPRIKNGSAICYIADRPKWYGRFAEWLGRFTGMNNGVAAPDECRPIKTQPVPGLSASVSGDIPVGHVACFTADGKPGSRAAESDSASPSLDQP